MAHVIAKQAGYDVMEINARFVHLILHKLFYRDDIENGNQNE
jgi:hypothetical protein